MAYTEYKTRKALGMRYSTDPALLLDQQRMEQEYGLMMPRAALAEQKRQADIQRQAQEDANKRSGMSGLVSTAGNLASTYGMMKMMSSGTPAVAPVTGISGAAPTVAPASNFTMGGANASSIYDVGSPITGGGSTIPTTTANLSTSAGTTANGVVPATMATTETETAATTGMGLSSLPVSAYVAPIGAGITGGQLGKSGTGKDIGKILMFGHGGEKENAAVAGSVAGSIGGAVAGGIAAGSSLTSWSGPGAIVGAVIGGIVGGVSALVDSHICTATHKTVGMSKDEIAKMELLKQYAIENHLGWWNSYWTHGTELVLEITSKENNIIDFYKDIRNILIEPIYKEQDIEKCFQIYLSVTKLLFKAYMPEFKFKEEN